MMITHRRSMLVLSLVALCAACSPTPSPQSNVSPVPTPSQAIAVSCGPLAEASCEQAVQVAVGTLGAAHPPVLSVQIEAPSAQRTCPPSGGPAGAHVCGVMAIVTTTEGATTVGLVETTGGWIWSNLIR
jgi:hypothetical protein